MSRTSYAWYNRESLMIQEARDNTRIMYSFDNVAWNNLGQEQNRDWC
jgi:hypothetical protein